MDNKVLQLTTNNVNETTERSTKAERLLNVLKYLGIAAIIIVAAMLAFVFLSSPVNGAIDSALEKAGIEPLTEAPVAYAWTSPTNGNTGTGWQSSLTNSNSTNNVSSVNFSPDLTLSNFTTANVSYAYNGNYNASGGLKTEMEGTPKISVLYFWEINFDEVAQAAVNNGQITQISVSLTSQLGSANWINGGEITGHYFACAGTANGDGTGLDGMSSTFSSSGANQYTVKIGKFLRKP